MFFGQNDHNSRTDPTGAKTLAQNHAAGENRRSFLRKADASSRPRILMVQL